MENKKAKNKGSIRDAEAKQSSSPATHFFYESQGARSVDPSILIESGITLWHERMLNNAEHDTSHLWEYARALRDTCVDTPMYSPIEWLRYRITMGDIVPKKWDLTKSYPYKGMLISAIYFQEARKLCEEGCTERAWHVIAIAYYNLGMNTTPTTTQSASKAAKVRHAERTELVRATVLAALNFIQQESSASSIEEAKNRVIELFRERKRVMEMLEKFDAAIPEKTKHNKENDAADRLRNTLDNWASPSGPYPEMAEAFAHFNKKERGDSPGVVIPNTRATTEEVTVEDCDWYMRILNVLENGDTLTVTLSREQVE